MEPTVEFPPIAIVFPTQIDASGTTTGFGSGFTTTWNWSWTEQPVTVFVIE